jgi:hypothetical protein
MPAVEGLSMEWITTRRPTERDGDEEGDVWVKSHPEIEGGTYLHWSIVPAGMAWQRHREADTGPAEPALTTTPRLFAAPPMRTWSPEGAEVIDAFADDGTAWWWSFATDQWIQHPPLPQP